MIPEVLEQHPLITAVSQFTHRLDGSVEQFKAEVQLIDGSWLYINEVYIDEELRKYAYYRLTPGGEILQGWDNAPHHPEITSYPHHLHQQGLVQSSLVRSLNDVLALLAPHLQD